jgi:hypothetical protein
MFFGSLASVTKNFIPVSLVSLGLRDPGVELALLTIVTGLSGIAELNINKVNFELLGGLDTNQEW